MEHSEALELYRRTGAYLEGHFRLSSGLHSPGYMQSALVLQHPANAASLGMGIAAHVKRYVAAVQYRVVGAAEFAVGAFDLAGAGTLREH